MVCRVETYLSPENSLSGFFQVSISPNGNLTSDGRFTYAWDAENRLLSATYANNTKVEFTYDYMGRRVSKKVSSWQNNNWNLSSDVKLVYDGWNCIAEFDASNNLLKSYLWGEDLSGSLQGAGGVGGLVCVRAGPDTYFPVYDGNGNITSYLDSSSNIKASYEYSPSPDIIAKSGLKADELAECASFSTKPYDKDLDAFLYPFRILKEGRWLSRDKIGERGGSNLYGANKNDNVNRIDALGLWSSIGGGDHKAFAIESFSRVRPACNNSKIDEKVIKNILDILVSENVKVDGDFFSNDEYHFTRPIHEYAESGKEKEEQILIQEYRRKYSENLKRIIKDFEKDLSDNPDYPTCKSALEKLGRVTHPWQDYYAHAIMNYNASIFSSGNIPNNSFFDIRDVIGRVTGSPDSPGIEMKPASFHVNTLFDIPIWFPDSSGEHHMGEPGDLASDSVSRRQQTVDFVEGKYEEYLIEKWWPKCFCKFQEKLSK